MDDTFETHYISLSYVIHLTDTEASQVRSDSQHDGLAWYPMQEALCHPNIHPFCADFLNTISLRLEFTNDHDR